MHIGIVDVLSASDVAHRDLALFILRNILTERVTLDDELMPVDYIKVFLEDVAYSVFAFVRFFLFS